MSEFLANEVQDFIETETDHAYDILVIETPPQHGKSTTLTESLPSWYMGKYDRRNVILASYNDDTAERFCRRNKDKIRSYGQQLFGITMKKERAEEIELAEGRGRMISRGIRAGITGNPGDLIIIDDPIKNREEADSPTWRSKIWEEWQNSIKSRLSAGAKVIIIMTPWHEDDLAARVLHNEKNARLIRLPVEAEANDILGREPGDALCPELGKDRKWLEDFKHAYINDPQGGIRAWTALYQCSPRVEEGNLIRREWWKYYDEEPVYATELISVDAAFKKTDNSDFVAITVWGKRDNYYYMRYCLNKRMTFTETLEAIRSVRRLYPRAPRLLIEDKANGSAIIDVLSREPGMFCIPINPKGGKEARVNAVAPAIEAGHVLLPRGAAWTEPFIDQFAKFPNDVHDDMVDSASQALTFMIFSSGLIDVILSKEEQMLVDWQEREEDAFLDSERMYDPYKVNDRGYLYD